MVMNFAKKAQIKAQSKVQVGALIFAKALIKVWAEYSDYNDVFSAENVAELSEHIRINDYVIKLEKDKELFFGPIYTLSSV